MPRSEPRPFATLGLVLVVALLAAGCAQHQVSPGESTNGTNSTPFANDTRSTPLSNATPGNQTPLLNQTMP